MEASKDVEIKDVYFRRFFVPVVIAILLLAGVFCILYNVPGVKPEWDTYSSVYGGQLLNQVAGGLRRSFQK